MQVRVSFPCILSIPRVVDKVRYNLVVWPPEVLEERKIWQMVGASEKEGDDPLMSDSITPCVSVTTVSWLGWGQSVFSSMVFPFISDSKSFKNVAIDGCSLG